MDSLQTIASRSHEFLDQLHLRLAGVEEWDESRRPAACALSCELSLEHARAVGVLFVAGLANSAVVAMRAQYEAVLRAAWLLYGASEADANRLLQPLNVQTEQEAKNIYGPQKMLDALHRSASVDPGLRGLVAPLTEAHAVLWKGLTSFAHAGIHPLHRLDKGFPVQLAVDMLKNSNLLSHFAARLLVRTGRPVHLHHEVDLAWQGSEDCLPSVRPVPGAA